MRTPGRIVDLSEVAGLDVRPVPGAIEHFATEDGRILSCARYGTLRERRPALNKRGRCGYLMVFIKSIGRNIPVHRLVIEVFVGPKPSPVHEVRHLDGNAHNNHAGNLAWGTHLENMGDCEAHGTVPRGARSGQHSKPERRSRRSNTTLLTEALVWEIRRRVMAGEPRKAVALDVGVRRNAVDRIMRGETWSHLAGGQAS